MLIVLEGLDKMGKSTLAKALQIALPDSQLTKEPGSPHVSCNPSIRSLVLNDTSLSPVARELLFYADALNHRLWAENCPQEQLIISDRGLWSHLAYLRGYLKTKQIDYEVYSDLRRLLLRHIAAVPDIVFYVKGSLELMYNRQEAMGEVKDAIEINSIQFYQAVSDEYDTLFTKAPNQFLLNAETPIDQNVRTMVCLIHSWRVANESGNNK